MNYRAIVKGYQKSVLTFLAGVIVMLFFLKQNAYATPMIKSLVWICLAIGGAGAGMNSRSRGYIHGAMVGLILWVTGCMLLIWFMPEIITVHGVITSLIYAVFWGTVGGVCGVNIAILNKKERTSLESNNL